MASNNKLAVGRRGGREAVRKEKSQKEKEETLNFISKWTMSQYFIHAQKHVLDGLKYSCYNNRDHYHNTMTTQLGIPMSPLRYFLFISSQPPSLPFNGPRLRDC